MALRADLLDFAQAVVSYGFAAEVTPFALGLGVLMWVTGFVAAYATYRHHRVFDAVLVVGAALLLNMSSTYADLFSFLVLFVLAALLLLLRQALLLREEGWQARRVNENLEVPAAIMRSGIVFIAGTIALAWILTAVAVAAPLTAAWRNLDVVWGDLSDQLSGVFGAVTNPQSRIPGSSFGTTWNISGEWNSDDASALTISASRPYYLRATTQDIYTGRGWRSSPLAERRVAPEQFVFPDDSPERPLTTDGFQVEIITVEIERASGRSLFSHGFPLRVWAPIIVLEPAGAPLTGGLRAAAPIDEGQGYQISAIVSQVSQDQLASAGTDYPEAIRQLYLATDRVTDRTRDLAREVTVGAANPYEQAAALERFLRFGDQFSYATTAPMPSDSETDIVDYFLFDGQVGYCQFYASAMVMMARSLGIPARMATGYAPGQQIGEGEYLVRLRNAHAWAELYFPGYGWQIFESTKTINPRFTRPSEGRTGGQAPINPLTGPGLGDFEEGLIPGVGAQASIRPIEGGYRFGDPSPVAQSRTGNAIVLPIFLLVAGAAAWWLLRRGRSRLRLLHPGDRAWFRLALAGGRAGVNPQPSETVYEYAAWLGREIPAREAEIREIADGKVWQTYSGRPMSEGMLSRIERAWQRLRLPLFWLALRRRAAALLPRRR
jgi:hypothetical protein